MQPDDLFSDIPAVFPLEFFSVRADIPYAKASPSKRFMRSHLLADTSPLLGEERFAEMGLAWNEEGVYVEVFVDKPFENAEFPNFSQADAIELFFDTRDLKTAGFATRFCHHFLLLPQPVQGIQTREMTHFRTEETHLLCEPTDLLVEVEIEKKAYSARLFIPAHCLHGYDTSVYNKIGFTYRIHRYGGEPQHFAVSSKHFVIEQTPRLWASLTLEKT